MSTETDQTLRDRREAVLVSGRRLVNGGQVDGWDESTDPPSTPVLYRDDVTGEVLFEGRVTDIDDGWEEGWVHVDTLWDGVDLPDEDDDDDEADDPTYLSMFREYVQGQSWIGLAERPLVFHLERLCKQLDRDPLAPAAVSSAYLQAFSRLDRRRPGATDPGDGLVPPGAQRSIFEEMD